MSRSSPFVVALTEEVRAVLVRRSGSYSASHGEVVRARIVLLAADGDRNIDIAAALGVHVDVVSRWRKRFCEEGLVGLGDRKRSGRPRVHDAEVVAGVKALACEPPSAHGEPLSRWSSADHASKAVDEGFCESLSSSTVRRWLVGRPDQAVAVPVVDLPSRS